MKQLRSNQPSMSQLVNHRDESREVLADLWARGFDESELKRLDIQSYMNPSAFWRTVAHYYKKKPATVNGANEADKVDEERLALEEREEREIAIEHEMEKYMNSFSEEV